MEENTRRKSENKYRHRNRIDLPFVEKFRGLDVHEPGRNRFVSKCFTLATRPVRTGIIVYPQTLRINSKNVAYYAFAEDRHVDIAETLSRDAILRSSIIIIDDDRLSFFFFFLFRYRTKIALLTTN